MTWPRGSIGSVSCGWVVVDSVELHKANMENRTQGGGGGAEASAAQSAVAAAAASSALANALPLAQLLAKPGALSALGLSGLTALTSLSEILTGSAGGAASHGGAGGHGHGHGHGHGPAGAVQTTGVHRGGAAGGAGGGAAGRAYDPKRGNAGSSSPPTGPGVKKERNKFAPY